MIYEESITVNDLLSGYVIWRQEKILTRLADAHTVINDQLEGVWVLVSWPHTPRTRIGIITRIDLFHGKFMFMLDVMHWRGQTKPDYPRDPQTGFYKRLKGKNLSGTYFRWDQIKLLARDKASPGTDFERRR